MSDRRRNIFVLLVVVGLLIASLAVILPDPAREGDEARPRPPGRRPARLRGAADQAAADGHGRRPPALARHHARARRPVRRRRAGAARAPAQNQIEVNLPGVDDAERAARQVGTTAQLYFYDWEPNVLDEECQTNPELGQRRPDRRSPGSTTPSSARRSASRRSTATTRRTARSTTPSTRRRSSRSTAGSRRRTARPWRADLADQGLLDTAEILEVPEGVIVVRNEDQRAPEQQEPARSTRGGCCATTRCSTARTSATRSRTSTSRAAASRSSRWSSPTRAAGHSRETTADIAQRGADNAALNGGLQDPIGASHHFAIRLDNELISTPFINFRENPDGIDGETGRADLRRLHHHLGAGPREPAQDRRAAAAARAHLPLAGVGHARPAGARPGPRRRPRRLRRRGDLPDRLLPRARRDRGARPRASTRSTSSR